jgi:hypothetical protein
LEILQQMGVDIKRKDVYPILYNNRLYKSEYSTQWDAWGRGEKYAKYEIQKQKI